jgi:hypothetical protein
MRQGLPRTFEVRSWRLRAEKVTNGAARRPQPKRLICSPNKLTQTASKSSNWFTNRKSRCALRTITAASSAVTVSLSFASGPESGGSACGIRVPAAVCHFHRSQAVVDFPMTIQEYNQLPKKKQIHSAHYHCQYLMRRVDSSISLANLYPCQAPCLAGSTSLKYAEPPGGIAPLRKKCFTPPLSAP